MSERDDGTRAGEAGRVREVVERLEQTVDRGASTAEEIHRAIAEFPFETLERLGVLDQTRSEVKRIHDQTVGSLYDLIRDVNHRVARFATGVIEEGDAPADAR